MQRAEDLRRVAAECVEDLAADGVVYAEVRYAPEQHLTAGLSLDEVVEAVQDGFEPGYRERRSLAGSASSSARSSPRCGTRPTRASSPSSRYGTATAASAGSTSPARRSASRPPGT